MPKPPSFSYARGGTSLQRDVFHFVGPTDPGPVGTGLYWVKTADPANYELYKRNPKNAGWIPMGMTSAAVNALIAAAITGLAGGSSGMGPEGPPGEDGAMGPPGQPGAAGAAGSAGATGPVGPAGRMGYDGVDGEDAMWGPQGAAGAAGTAGSAGSPGAQGPIGIKGLDGEDGLDAWLPGPAGVAGAAGTTGATGPTGLPSMPIWAPDEPEPALMIPGPAGPAGVAGGVFYNASVDAVSAAYAADTYLAGSLITIPTAGSWKAGTIYYCVFDMAKTNAGTAAFTIRVRMGTLGTTGDALVATIAYAVGTAVVDTGIFEVFVNFRSVGAGSAAVLASVGFLNHQVAAAGLATTGAVGTAIIKNTSAGFDSTTQTKIGLSLLGGASFSGTNTLVQSMVSGI